MIAGAPSVAVMSTPPLPIAFIPLANMAATFESGVHENPREPAESLSWFSPRNNVIEPPL